MKHDYNYKKYVAPVKLVSSEPDTIRNIESADIELLKYCLTTPEDDIFELLSLQGHIKLNHFDDSIKHRHMHFVNQKKSDYKVLLVSHVDTVTELDRIDELVYQKGVLHARCLDNRLGLYTCLELIKNDTQGIYDLLITDHEEQCASTAQYFNCPDIYNFITEFDRMNVLEFVQYDSCKALSDDIEAVTYCKQGMGSYSDIADIMTMTASINWAVAFADYHNDASHVVWDDYLLNIEQFRVFINWAQENNKSYIYNVAPNSMYKKDYPDDDYTINATTTTFAANEGFTDYDVEVIPNDPVNLYDYLDSLNDEEYAIEVERLSLMSITDNKDTQALDVEDGDEDSYKIYGDSAICP